MRYSVRFVKSVSFCARSIDDSSLSIRVPFREVNWSIYVVGKWNSLKMSIQTKKKNNTYESH
ncbi:unnamed protein product [Periconia digitata]|uniref:Uncharacterized protein n=1 Tax=Periconia digitata TaxID=1303443 RepID=A0A9W4XMH3_9PLEO|nr:unnamed protein product [Periconia digitata]